MTLGQVAEVSSITTWEQVATVPGEAEVATDIALDTEALSDLKDADWGEKSKPETCDRAKQSTQRTKDKCPPKPTPILFRFVWTFSFSHLVDIATVIDHPCSPSNPCR